MTTTPLSVPNLSVDAVVARVKQDGHYDRFRRDCTTYIESLEECIQLKNYVESVVQRELCKHGGVTERTCLKAMLLRDPKICEQIDNMVARALDDERIDKELVPSITNVVEDMMGIPVHLRKGNIKASLSAIESEQSETDTMTTSTEDTQQQEQIIQVDEGADMTLVTTNAEQAGEQAMELCGDEDTDADQLTAQPSTSDDVNDLFIIKVKLKQEPMSDPEERDTPEPSREPAGYDSSSEDEPLLPPKPLVIKSEPSSAMEPTESEDVKQSHERVVKSEDAKETDDLSETASTTSASADTQTTIVDKNTANKESVQCEREHSPANRRTRTSRRRQPKKKQPNDDFVYY